MKNVRSNRVLIFLSANSSRIGSHILRQRFANNIFFFCSSYGGVVYLRIQIVNLRILTACLIARIRAAVGPLQLGSWDHNFPKSNIL